MAQDAETATPKPAQDELEDDVYYDPITGTPWKLPGIPERFHLLPLNKLIEMGMEANKQAWIEWLYPFTGAESYPFLEGQTAEEKSNRLKEYSQRVYQWNDGNFERSDIKNWVDKACFKLKFAAENSSGSLLQWIVGGYPEEPIEFGKVESTEEANERKIKHWQMNDIARRALLQKFFMDPPYPVQASSQPATTEPVVEKPEVVGEQGQEEEGIQLPVVSIKEVPILGKVVLVNDLQLYDRVSGKQDTLVKLIEKFSNEQQTRLERRTPYSKRYISWIKKVNTDYQNRFHLPKEHKLLTCSNQKKKQIFYTYRHFEIK